MLLDAVRAAAALLVLVGHWRNFLFVSYPELTVHRALLAAPYLLSSAAHQSVIVFFVLSGYLISGSVFRMFATNRWSWRNYLTHRLVRLWIVLLPCLALGALWDSIGLHLNTPASIALYRGVTNAEMSDVHTTFHISVLAGNVFFLQTIRVPIFGSNGALWSLANEFWYYILFPVGLLLLHRKTPLPARLGYLILLAGLVYLLPSGILLLFAVWLMGTLLAVLPAPTAGRSVRLAASAVYIPLTFVFAKQHTLGTYPADLLFGAFSLLYLWILLSARSPAREQHPATRFSRTVARFSYTLYLAHQPLLALAAALFVGLVRWTPDAKHLLLAFLLLGFALLFAWGLASLTEFRTDAVRRRVESLLPGRGSSLRRA